MKWFMSKARTAAIVVSKSHAAINIADVYVFQTVVLMLGLARDVKHGRLAKLSRLREMVK